MRVIYLSKTGQQILVVWPVAHIREYICVCMLSEVYKCTYINSCGEYIYNQGKSNVIMLCKLIVPMFTRCVRCVCVCITFTSHYMQKKVCVPPYNIQTILLLLLNGKKLISNIFRLSI